MNVYQETVKWAEGSKLDVQAIPETGSTNDLAKQGSFSQKAAQKLYLTGYQTAGRGRGSNVWISPKPNTSLLCSLALSVSKAPQPVTSPLIGLALFQAASNVWPKLPWSLKAPNDLYLQDKKVAGILIEVLSKGSDHRLIVGIGFNVTDAPLNLKTATSLSAHTKLEPGSWGSFLGSLYKNINDLVASGPPSKLNAQEKELILKALNKNPLLEEPYLGVSDLGALTTAKGTVPWL